MPRLILPFAALAALIPLASAGVSFISPKAGATLTAGTAIEVKWEEGGTGPKLSDLLSYQLFLYAGGTAVGGQQELLTITTQGTFAAGNSASAVVGVSLGEDSPKNAYFIKMIAVAKAGGQLITYSDRFSYSGMTGTFPPIAKAGVANFDGTTQGPPTQDNTVQAGAGAAPAAPQAGDFSIAYTMQTGTIRYAPMQPVPPTKITAKNTQPLYPTSSVSLATTRLPIPKVQTTVTQSQTYSVSSMENTVAAAPNPTDDMQKFLNRWKD